jgi:dynein heavy chain 1
MDQKLEGILCKKLEEIINIWIKEFSNFGQVENAMLVKEASVHKIKLKDQMIYLEPGTQDAREFWYGQFHQSVLNSH